MKKINSVKDITSGMLVTLRNGNKMTVVTTTVYGNMDKCCTELALFAPGEDGDDDYWPLSEYSNNFKFRPSLSHMFIYEPSPWDISTGSAPEFDIVQVWSCTCPCNAFANTTEDRELLWSDPSYTAETWDELTEEEKDAECSKHMDCRDYPYDNKGCNDPDDEPEKLHEDAAALLDELREECKDNTLASMIFKAFGGDLPDGYADYVLGKTNMNPERKPTQCGVKSLAEALYEIDNKLSDDGVGVIERDVALLAAMHLACGDHKD